MSIRSRQLSALALPLSIAALLAGACDEPTLPGSDEPADADLDVEATLDEASPYRLAAGLAVPLADLDPAVLAVAEMHLEVASRGMRGADGWVGAELYPLALPLLRPDIDGPAYYELKLVRAGEDAGFMVVATGDHDDPLPEFNTRGMTPAELLAQQATAPVAAFYRLDSFITIAEDEAGAVTAATTEQLPVAQVEVPAGDSFATTDWSAWPALRRDFARGFAREIAAVREGHAEAWQGARGLRVAAAEAAAGDGASFRRHWWDAWDQGATVYECENNWAGPNNGSSDPNALTVHWSQIEGDFRHVTTGLEKCASGCTPTGAAIVLAWLDQQSKNPLSGPWSRPDAGRAFFRYRRNIPVDQLPFVDHGRPVALLPGQSLVPKTGLYDYSAAPPTAWVGQVATPSALESANSTVPAEDMRRYLLELSTSMGTKCSGSAGSTSWQGVKGLAQFLEDHRVPAKLTVVHDLLGSQGVTLSAVKSLRDTGAPAFINTGGLFGHTEVVNAHYKCQLRDKASNTITWFTDNYFYLNKGWGTGNTASWQAAGNLHLSATLEPKSPWQKLVASHSSQCADVPYGEKVDGLALQQFPCSVGTNYAQRWQFLPQTDGSYMIESSASGKCIEVYGYSLDNNAQVVQWACYGGNNQRWRAEMRPDGRFQLRNVHSNKCLEVAGFGQNPGAGLVQYSCDGAASQMWDLQL